MRRRPRFPPSFREKLAANEAALKAMSPTGELPERMQAQFDALRPKPRKPRLPRLDVGEKESAVFTDIVENNAPPLEDIARKHMPRVDSPHKEPLERDILKAIVQALRYHPRVIKCVRANSGGAYFRNAQGKDALVTFTSEPVPDLHIMLRNPCGWGWLEIKRPSFKGPRDAREERQAAFLAAVREAGGVGCFVRSVTEALEAIA